MKYDDQVEVDGKDRGKRGGEGCRGLLSKPGDDPVDGIKDYDMAIVRV